MANSNIGEVISVTLASALVVAGAVKLVGCLSQEQPRSHPEPPRWESSLASMAQTFEDFFMEVFRASHDYRDQFTTLTSSLKQIADALSTHQINCTCPHLSAPIQSEAPNNQQRVHHGTRSQ